MVHGGGNGSTRIEDLDTRLHSERLLQHVRASVSVPAMGEVRSVLVDVSLDTGLSVTASSESLLKEVKAGLAGAQLTRHFKGKVRVVTATGGK